MGQQFDEMDDEEYERRRQERLMRMRQEKIRQLKIRKLMRLTAMAAVLALVVVAAGTGIARLVSGGDKKPSETISQEVKADTEEEGEILAAKQPVMSASDLEKLASDTTIFGWQQDENGRWYRNADGTFYENGWKEIDGVKYYFDENGVMLTGWQCVKEKAEPGDGTGISRFVYLGGKEKGMLKGRWFETTEKPWDTKAWSTALNTQAVRKNNTDETALMKKDGSRWFYLENDGTPLFLSADATGLKDGAVKLDGRYYFFDSYGVCQSGMIKFTSGGKTETAYFDPEAGGALSIGRNTNVVDKRDKVYTFCSGTSGSEKGCGINGVKDGFLYYNGLLVSAKEGSSYEPFKVSGQVYLVNEAGKVQTEEKKYSSDGNAAYTIENGKVFTLDENGEKKSAATGLSLPYASWKIQYQR